VIGVIASPRRAPFISTSDDGDLKSARVVVVEHPKTREHELESARVTTSSR
jgi:hypothetical protein